MHLPAGNPEQKFQVFVIAISSLTESAGTATPDTFLPPEKKKTIH
jgi:hypothetical protein